MSDKIRMWLDDIRDPANHGCIGWTWVTSADEAIALLATGNVIAASLDHDLDIDATLGKEPTSKTGMDVVRWMTENRVYPRDGVTVHSLNPTGKRRMLSALWSLRSELDDVTPAEGARP